MWRTTDTVLFVPGAFTDRRLFAHQLDHLDELATPRFVELADVDSLAVMAEAILADAPERFALAGLSLGGIVALELVKREPERVTRLALLATTAEPDPPPVAAGRRVVVERVRGGEFAQQVELLLPVLSGPLDRERGGDVAAVRAMVRGVGAARYARQVEAIVNRPDQRGVAAGIA
ncbi:MAG: alpha/beta hydrolase [Alphaproteobacteria bacterium]|nr:alpha/beta hydrolase [Alphaproteobacteria bacterium]